MCPVYNIISVYYLEHSTHVSDTIYVGMYMLLIHILIYSSINLRFNVTHVTFPTGLISFKNAVNKYSKVNEPQSYRSKY